MKKYAIIGLVLAALAVMTLSSCGPKGGTIVVKNNAVFTLGSAETAADLKVSITCIVPPVSKSGVVPKNGQLSFNLDDDGDYTIALDFLGDPLTSGIAHTAGVKPNPSKVTLKGGNTETVTLTK